MVNAASAINDDDDGKTVPFALAGYESEIAGVTPRVGRALIEGLEADDEMGMEDGWAVEEKGKGAAGSLIEWAFHEAADVIKEPEVGPEVDANSAKEADGGGVLAGASGMVGHGPAGHDP